MHAAEYTLRIFVALRCAELKQPPSLCTVHRPALSVAKHVTEHALCLGVAFRCCEPKQPPRLCMALRPAFAAVVHGTELEQRDLALICACFSQTSRCGDLKPAPVFDVLILDVHDVAVD